MSDDEIFYDSLDESEDRSSSFPPDLSVIVPLYTGDTSKTKIISTRKRKTEKKTHKTLVHPEKPRRSYLTMYYKKINKTEVQNGGNGSNTCRAICEKVSPRRDVDIEPDLEGVQSQLESDLESEQEDFYEQVMNVEVQKKPCGSSTGKKTSPKTSAPEGTGRFIFKYSDTERIEKLERLKKRQNYGTKMSLKNRIQIQEEQSLRKIKNHKV